jgi:hypothetical protein
MVTDKLGHSHLGITLHWIDSSYEQFNILLCLRTVTGRHTGARLASEMLAELQAFDIHLKVVQI